MRTNDNIFSHKYSLKWNKNSHQECTHNICVNERDVVCCEDDFEALYMCPFIGKQSLGILDMKHWMLENKAIKVT